MRKGNLLNRKDLCHTSYKNLLTKGELYMIEKYKKQVSISNFDKGCHIFYINTNDESTKLEFIEEQGDYTFYLQTDISSVKLTLKEARNLKLKNLKI